jgi:hypothetical protein
MKELIGHIVKKIYVSPGEANLSFEIEDGSELVYSTEAHCCSETWFADIAGLSNLGNQVITAADEILLPDPSDERSRQEYDRAYGIVLVAGGPAVTIIYRNSSNGYYGGGCSFWEGARHMETWLCIYDSESTRQEDYWQAPGNG